MYAWVWGLPVGFWQSIKGHVPSKKKKAFFHMEGGGWDWDNQEDFIKAHDMPVLCNVSTFRKKIYQPLERNPLRPSSSSSDCLSDVWWKAGVSKTALMGSTLLRVFSGLPKFKMQILGSLGDPPAWTPVKVNRDATAWVCHSCLVNCQEELTHNNTEVQLPLKDINW